MKTFSKAVFVLVTIILGGIVGSKMYVYGEGTAWQRLDYFPLPVENILVVKPFGEEFWVETTDGEVYKVAYPCTDGQTCWEPSNDVPPSPPNGDYVDENVHEYLFYDNRQDVCINDFSISPFPEQLKTCVTFVAKAESFYVFSLGLSDKNELWIWDNPWRSPYDTMYDMFIMSCWGSVFGLIAGVLLIRIPIRVDGGKFIRW